LAGNRKFFIPKDSYSGENITNAIEVEILTNTSAQIGKILIPIHFYLDKYGLSALNG
jgi:polyhydroxyalkanoate synthesis regulator protein